MKCIVMLLAAMAALALTGRAADIYVAPDGSDDNGGTAWTNALATIGAGVGKATNTGPHTVYVSNGPPYAISSEIVLTNNITVRSWNAGALDPTGTIVDGNAVTRGFKLTHAGAVLAGVTVRNGTNATSGGGVYVSGGGTVTQCVLSGNSARDGGGLYIYNGLVTHSTIRENVAVSNSTTEPARGGGLFLYRYGVVSNCQISDNTVTSRLSQLSTYNRSGGAGIGVLVDNVGNVCRVYDSQISNNVSDYYGGGIQLYQTIIGQDQMIVSDTTVRGNTARVGGGGVAAVNNKHAGLWARCVVEANVSEDGAIGGGGAYSLVGSTMHECTLRGNSAVNYGGAGYQVDLFDSLVESNRAKAGGGLIYFSYTSTISNCLVRGNYTTNTFGGGIYVAGGAGVNATIQNCTLQDNTTATHGGGLYMSIGNTNPPQSGRIIGCLIYNNVALNSAGGVRVGGAGYVLSACTVVSNLAIGSDGGGGVYLSVGAMTNCIVYSNLAPAILSRNNLYLSTASYTDKVWYCCTPGVISPAQGNITDEPQFADFGAADFRLTANSPCVNAGTNESWMTDALDLDGRPRLDRFTGRVDMGAYERVLGGSLIRLR